MKACDTIRCLVRRESAMLKAIDDRTGNVTVTIDQQDTRL
jgi:hypothetical protein